MSSIAMVMRAAQTLKQYLKLAGYVRWLRLSVAFVFLLSLFIPALMQISEQKAYALSPEMENVLGSANKNLSAKFSFNQAASKWQFNKKGFAALAADIAKKQGEKDVGGIAAALTQTAAKQVGGSGKKNTSLYSVDLPVKAEEGIVYYDNVTHLSFKMVPTFYSRDAKLIDDRIVYPIGGGAKIVYTAMTNGLKEDIILPEYIDDTLRYSYTMELPDSLEARILEDGSVGIYSGNPALYGNISYSNDDDKARVMEARKSSSKDNLVFGIPAPFIKDQNGQAGHTRYELKGKQLTVVAEGLKGLQYPLTVDPSVTITSSSDFENGNSEGEGNITFADGEIRRGTVSGGTAGVWASADTGAAFSPARAGHNSVAYNGYLYVVGGGDSGGGSTDVSYAAICTGTNINGGCTGSTAAGKVGTWTVGNSLVEGRGDNGVVAYNGYLYSIGGQTGGANISSMVQRSQIGANGAPGTWSNIGAFPTNIVHHEAVAYDGRLYVAGGCTALSGALCSDFNGNVYTATINGNGSLSSWTQLTGTPLGTARYGHTTFAYNGYLYVAGGCSAKDIVNNCTNTTTSVEYAKINSDGTLGSWAANTSLTTARRGVVSAIHNGYIYFSGDDGISNYIQYAPIHSSGVIGTWSSTTAYTTAKKNVAMASYNGYLYITGGCTSDATNCNLGAGYTNVTEYTKIDSAGSVGGSNSTTAFDVEASGRSGPASVTAFGYIYVLGGEIEGGGTGNTVKFAPINTDGSVGAWSNGNSFSEPRAYAKAIVRGNYLYLIGGLNHTGTANCPNVGTGADYCNNIEWAVIDQTTGALTWQGSTFTYSAQGRSDLGAAIVNDYLYVLGGVHNNNSTSTTEVNYAQINANGSLGSFSATTTPMQTARANLGAFAHNGRIYAVGNRVGGASEYATPDSNGNITTSWTSTGSVPKSSADRYHTAVYSKGYAYLTGGLSSAAVYSDEIQIAKINSDGTMSSWSTSSNVLTSVRSRHSAVVHNDRLYILGGDQSILNSVALVSYHNIGNGGGGATGSWTASGSTFIGSRMDHESVAHNGYLYVIGGCDTTSCVTRYNDVRYAVINGDGTLGAWASTNTITARWQHTSVVHNGYLYVIGGGAAGGNTTNTQYALICTGNNSGTQGCSSTPGSVGTWYNATNNFSNARSVHASVVHNGYLYVIGGYGGGTSYYNDVQYALLCTGSNTTGGCAGLQAGDIGTWVTDSGASFNTGRTHHAGVANGGYLYVLGGQNDSGAILDAQYAPINSDGSIGNWAYTNPMPPQSHTGEASVLNGYLYMGGGFAGASFLPAIHKAPISSGGPLGEWEKTTSLITGRLRGDLTYYNGVFYFSGGCTAGAFNVCTIASNNVEHAGQQALARTGHYSKLISVNPTTGISGVHYNGSLGAGSSVSYRVAPSSGVFGTATAAVQGNGSEPTPLCGQGDVYYVQLKATLDDSTKAGFPDDNISTVTDVMTYYRLNATPTPNLRLNGGKWFNGEVQQPLDICKL